MTEIEHLNLQNPPPSECPDNLTYLPESLRPRLLSRVHTTLSSGHPGITATENLLRNRLWWPTLLTDTTKYVQTCITCNTSKSLRQLPAGLLNPLPTPRRPWSHIVIDFITDLPNSIGNTTILTIVDRFSKACRLIPLPKLPTSFETAELLCNHVFRFYGLPEDIVSDRGPQFTSRVWSAFFRNVNISLTSRYHPQSNGQTERLNQEVIRFLRSYCQRQQSDWRRYLLWAEYAQNYFVKPATWPLSRAFWASNLHCFPGLANPPNYLQSRTGYNRARKSGTGLIPIYFMPWDVKNNRPIDINTPTPNTPQANGSGCQPRICASDFHLKKLSPRYVGPFKISRQISPVSFRLELPSNYRISPTFHVSLLKPAGGPSGETEMGARPQTPLPFLVDGEEAHRVHELLDSRRRCSTLQYLVDWEGFGPEERSLVNAGDILDPTLTEEFHRTHPEKPAPRPRGRPRRRLLPRAMSRSQGGGSVTEEAPVPPPSHHQREPSPEY